MPSILIVGSVGAGKTYNAVAQIAKNKDKGYQNVYANMDMMHDKLLIHKWLDPAELKDANCGYVLVDEADMWFNSRNYAQLDETFRNLLKEHRKHHLRIIYTTQHLSMIDKIMRIFLDEVWLVKKVSFPIIGWIWPKCVRPDIVCHHCGLVRIDDGRGDRDTPLKRWLGFGTFYVWSVYPTSSLRDEEDMQEIEEMDVKRKGWGVRLFDLEIARMYDISEKVSEHAHEYRKQKKASRFGRRIFKQS